jgi:pseudouridine kinase
MDVAAQTATALLAADSTPGRISCTPGGVARNVAENLARLGWQAHLISAVGADAFGGQLLQASRAAGVNMDAVLALPDQRTALYLSLHGPDGDMAYAVNDMDILLALTPQRLQGHADLLARANCWVLDCNLAPPALAWLLGRPQRPAVLVDAVSVAKCTRLLPWLGHIHTLKVNRLEAQVLSGQTIDTVAQAQAAARHLHDQGVAQVVLSLGAMGVCWCDAKGQTGHRAAPPVAVQSTTGAGDALLAGLVHGQLTGMALAHSVAFAMACAEITLGSWRANAPDLCPQAVYSRLGSNFDLPPDYVAPSIS